MIRRVSILLFLAAGCGRDGVFVAPRPGPTELTLLTERLADGEVGVTYTAPILADGPDVDAVRWRITSGGVPGLELLFPTGVRTHLAGIPTTPGEFQVRIGADDGMRSVERDFEVVVRGDDPPKPLEIVKNALSDAVENEPYTVGIGATGGSESGYRWGIASGTLPRGLAMAREGTLLTTISGTPRDSGYFPFVVEVTDSAGARSTAAFSLVVLPRAGPLIITTSSLRPAAVGAYFEDFIEATGGAAGSYVWEWFGNVPDGLFLAPEGAPSTSIFGFPEVPGTYGFTIRVADAAGNTDERGYRFLVEPRDPLEILTETVPPGVEGSAYTAHVRAANGVPPMAWSIQGLPAGLTVNDFGGSDVAQISGIPSEEGRFDLLVEVFDSANQSAARQLVLEIEGGPEIITPAALPPATTGDHYSATIGAVDGTTPYTWSITGGALPPGLSLAGAGTPSTTLNGTPAASGTFAFTVEVRDADGGTDDVAFTLEVQPPATPLTIVTSTIGPAARCAGFSQTITASGGSGIGYRWSWAGPLPPGLSLLEHGTPSTTLIGAPTAGGAFQFTVQVEDSDGNIATRSYFMMVAPSSGERFAVFVADSGVDDRFEVFASPVCGGAPAAATRISPSLTHPGDALISQDALQYSPDLTRVAFLGDFGQDDVTELYVVAFTASGPGPALPASGTMPATADVVDFAWSPDGTRIAFRADRLLDGVPELWVAELGSAAAVPAKANGALPPGGYVRGGYRWSPDSTRIAYRADQLTAQVPELFVADVASSTGTTMRVNTNLTPGGQVNPRFLWSPDGAALLYLAPQDIIGATELYLVDVNGAAPAPPAKVNGPLVANGDVRPWDFSFSPTGDAVVYLADQDTNDVDELYLADLLGGSSPPAKLNPPLGSPSSDVRRVELAPEGDRLLYVADTTVAGVDELFLLDLSSSAAALVRVTPSYAGSGPGTAGFIASGRLGLGWSPDGDWIAFRDRVSGVTRSFLVDAGGPTLGTPIRIDAGNNDPGRQISALDYAPDASKLMLRGDLDTDNVQDLYVMHLQPAVGSLTKVNASAGGGSVSLFPGDALFTDDAAAVLYLGDQGTSGAYELWMADVFLPAPGAPARLHVPFSAFSDAERLVLRSVR